MTNFPDELSSRRQRMSLAGRREPPRRGRSEDRCISDRPRSGSQRRTAESGGELPFPIRPAPRVRFVGAGSSVEQREVVAASPWRAAQATPLNVQTASASPWPGVPYRAVPPSDRAACIGGRMSALALICNILDNAKRTTGGASNATTPLAAAAGMAEFREEAAHALS